MVLMTSPSSSSVVNTDLPKWQPILLNTNPINNNIISHGSGDRLIFGLTPPTVALIALAIFLCILVEILGKKVRAPTSSSSSDLLDPTVIVDHQYRKQQPITMIKYWNNNIDQQPAATAGSNSKVSNKKRAFFSQMLGVEMICSFVLKGVLDFENAAVEGNLYAS